MPDKTLQRWQAAFRKEARADRNRRLRRHLRKLHLPQHPNKLREGTELLLLTCCTYAAMDNRTVNGFIEQQRYNPADAPGAEYLLTFDFCRKGYGRLLVTADFDIVDLADLYGHAWYAYGVCGYHTLYISRADGNDLDFDEVDRLKQTVTDDLRFDYSEDELDFWFDDESIDGVLMVRLQERFE